MPLVALYHAVSALRVQRKIAPDAAVGEDPAVSLLLEPRESLYDVQAAGLAQLEWFGGNQGLLAGVVERKLHAFGEARALAFRKPVSCKPGGLKS